MIDMARAAVRRVRHGPVLMSKNKRFSKHDIGEFTYGRPRVFSFHDDTGLKIGRFCSIAHNVTILLGGEHHTDLVTTYPFGEFFPKAERFSGRPFSRGAVVIGNDVWIGLGALVLSGVEIGDGAVIAAHSVVRKDVEPYSIVGGNPARHIRFRFSASQIRDLQAIAWWNWPIEKIVRAWPLLLSPSIDAFISEYREDPGAAYHVSKTRL